MRTKFPKTKSSKRQRKKRNFPKIAKYPKEIR